MNFNEKLIQLLNAKSLLPSNATISQPKLSQLSSLCNPILMKILDKGLENDRSDGFDHSYMLINATHVNTNFSLTLLISTLDPTPTPDQSFTSVSNAT